MPCDSKIPLDIFSRACRFLSFFLPFLFHLLCIMHSEIVPPHMPGDDAKQLATSGPGMTFVGATWLLDNHPKFSIKAPAHLCFQEEPCFAAGYAAFEGRGSQKLGVTESQR